MGRRREHRAVVLTALQVEYDAVRRLLRDIQPRVYRGSRYEVGVVEASERTVWRVLIAEVGAGNSTAAAEATRAIEYFAPHIALFVGVAGGLKHVAIGDVVVADKIYGYQSGKDGRRFSPRPNVGQSTHRAVHVARQVSRDWNRGQGSTSWVKCIAAGESVVAATTSATFRLLTEHYDDALAVEMEGVGFLAATRLTPDVDALVIRGISDLIDGKAAAEQRGSQALASKNAADFALRSLAVYAADEYESQNGSVVQKLGYGVQHPRPAEVDGHAPLEVFVSSRLGLDLDRERAIVADAVESLSPNLARAWLWERDGAGGPSVRNVCIEAAKRCDAFALLLASDVSPIVRAEFRAAHEAGAECFVFVKKTAKARSRCRTFLNTLGRASLVPLSFQNESELRTHLINALHHVLRSRFRAGSRS